jgi:peptidyl-prolyl cis-trans isomerase D
MLRNFRAVFKGNQTPMTVIMLVVLVSMVAYLGNSMGRDRGSESVVARVYGRDVLLREVLELSENMKQDRRAPQDERTRAGQALEQLVQLKLREELAERHGIVVTDEELRIGLQNRLRQYPFLLDDKGQLKPTSEITKLLTRAHISLIKWENETRQQLMTMKLVQQASALAPVDEAWLNQEHRIQNEKISFETASLSPDMSPVADPGDEPLAAFLKASGARFQVGLRRTIQYVIVDKDSMGDAVKVDDAAIQAAYESKKSQYTELQASHILFRASDEAQFAAATAKAQELRAKLVTGLDFAKSAEQFSEDPTAKGSGGKLPKFSSGAMVKPFEDAAMAMKVGEISQPVRTQFGIHLIKLEGRTEKTLEDVKGILNEQLSRERFDSKAKEKLEQLRKRAGSKGDLAPGARALNLKVQTSAPFLEEQDAVIQGLPFAGPIPGEAFRLKIGQVSKVQKVGQVYVLFRVQEEKASTIPPLSEIRPKVLAAWKLEEARKKAMEKAQTALKSGNLADLAVPTPKDNVTIQSLGWLGDHPAIRKALLETPVDGLTPALWTPDGQIWIARIKARTPAEPLTFEKRQSLVQSLQNSVAMKLLIAELQDLDAKGRLKPGFSSLRGRWNGIWIDTEWNKTPEGSSEAE